MTCKPLILFASGAGRTCTNVGLSAKSTFVSLPTDRNSAIFFASTGITSLVECRMYSLFEKVLLGKPAWISLQARYLQIQAGREMSASIRGILFCS